MNLSYIIEDKKITILEKINGKNNCINCGELLMIVSANCELIKTRCTFTDKKNDLLILRCPKCGIFTSFQKKKKSICFLTI